MSIVKNKYTLPFKTVRLGLVPCKESLVHKITVQFNSFIDFEWSNNFLFNNSCFIITLLALCCLLLVTDMSELDNIHPLGPSDVTQDLSVKII